MMCSKPLPQRSKRSRWRRLRESGPPSPQGSHGFFLKYWRRATLVGESDRAQERFDLGIVGHGDASALPWRTIKAAPSIGAVAAARSARRSHTSGASLAAAAASSAGTSGASIGPHRQRTSLGIYQVQLLLACCGDADLEERTVP